MTTTTAAAAASYKHLLDSSAKNMCEAAFNVQETVEDGVVYFGPLNFFENCEFGTITEVGHVADDVCNFCNKNLPQNKKVYFTFQGHEGKAVGQFYCSNACISTHCKQAGNGHLRSMLVENVDVAKVTLQHFVNFQHMPEFRFTVFLENELTTEQ